VNPAAAYSAWMPGLGFALADVASVLALVLRHSRRGLTAGMIAALLASLAALATRR